MKTMANNVRLSLFASPKKSENMSIIIKDDIIPPTTNQGLNFPHLVWVLSIIEPMIGSKIISIKRIITTKLVTKAIIASSCGVPANICAVTKAMKNVLIE